MKYFIVSLFFLFVPFYLSNTQDVVQGLFYLDNSPVSIEIQDGKIHSIRRLSELPANARNLYIAPGFIDNQVNGFAGTTFSLGSGVLSRQGIKDVTMGLWKSGVTTYFPTLTTNSHNLLVDNLNLLNDMKNDPSIRGSIAGIHMEGPYISPIDGYRGAHPKEHVRKPDWNEFMEYYNASGGKILQVTIAPEIEGALEFISACSKKNIVIALGHHNASSDIIFEAIDYGAKIATHLGNGAANMIHRHNNPFWPQLADDRLMISIICDGFHLTPDEVKTFYKVKGTENTIITSDVTEYGGLPVGNYSTGEGDPIEITPEGKLINLAQNGLYGSATPISLGVGNIMKYTGCSLAEAVKMASTNPARLYGLKDRGEIIPGSRADLILFTITDFKLDIIKTFVAGELVYNKDNPNNLKK